MEHLEVKINKTEHFDEVIRNSLSDGGDLEITKSDLSLDNVTNAIRLLRWNGLPVNEFVRSIDGETVGS